MPHLINISRFHDHTSFGKTKHNTYDPAEFFCDASYDSYSSRWNFDVNKTYPHVVYAHLQTQQEVDKWFLIDLRRFVERKANGDVIYSVKHLGYKWCWNEKEAKGSWDRKYTSITHDYWVFNFEDKEDLVMWTLMKPTLMVGEMSRFHPDCDYHNEQNTMQH